MGGQDTEERRSIVYIHENKINGKLYIGKTKQKAKIRWRDGEGYIDSPKFYNAIKLYGWNNFNHIIYAEKLTEEEAYSLEKELISKFNSIKNGYNIAPGGKCPKDYSDEAIERMKKGHEKQAEKMRGKKHSEEAKKKMSESAKGHSVSEELKKKLSDDRKGIERPDLRGENNGMYGRIYGNNPAARAVICIETNELFSTLKEASEKTGNSVQHILRCIHGHVSSRKGKFNWKYAEN